MILGRTEAVLMVRTWEASMRMGRGVGENAAPASVARLESDCVSGLGAGTAHLATRQKPAILVSMNRTSLLLTFQDAGPRNQALADLTAWMNGQLLLDPSADNKANLKP